MGVDFGKQHYDNGDRLEPSTRLWPDENDGPWGLTFEWQVLNGRAECVGLRITSVRPEKEPSWTSHGRLPEAGTPLTTGALRGIRLSELVAEERIRNQEVWSFAVEPTHAALYRADSMRPATRERLVKAAEAYGEAWRNGQAPTQAVAQALAVTDSAAAKLVSRARAAGLLPPTSPGVAAAGSEPGDE